MIETINPPTAPSAPGQLWPRPKKGDPTWGLVNLYPRQGHWTRSLFLALPDDRGIELVDGYLEFLPMPTKMHQMLIGHLYIALVAHLDAMRVQLAGYNLETINDRMRQPDILATLDARNFADDRATHADLAIEILSPGPENRRRDEQEKREEYASAGIPEYWIVDPESRSIVVLTLNGDAYAELGRFTAGQVAVSKVIDGFAVSVDECFTTTNG